MISDAFRIRLCLTSPEPIGLVVESARDVWVTTADGKRYLDLTAGIGVANVGHGRLAIAEAVAEQLDRHAHVMVYGEYEQAAQTCFADAFIRLLPDGFDRVFLTSTGTEAIEGAMKTARKFTGRTGFVAFEGSYHGDTMGALALQESERYRKPFEPLVGPVAFLPFDSVNALKAIDDTVAGVVIEPVQGEGGIRVPSIEFLIALRNRCTEVGALLIFDEVLTGFGRTGTLFAMNRCEDALPDVACFAKAMGGGLPLGGFAASNEILATLSVDPPLNHVTTFGGHPVSCAAGVTALGILVEESLAENAADVGRYFRQSLDAVVGRGGVEEIRGIGLMIGIRFVDASHTRRFVERALEGGLLLGWTLHCDDLVRVTPPLTLTRDQVDLAMERIADALA